MLRPNAADLKVYLHRAPVDMRKGRMGLAALAQEVIKQDPFGGSLFVFVGKRYDALKILYWDINGYALWHKVIENDQKFHWPRLFEEDVVTLTSEQLEWLMDGYDIWAQPHQRIKFIHAN
jgi:transposase